MDVPARSFALLALSLAACLDANPQFVEPTTGASTGTSATTDAPTTTTTTTTTTTSSSTTTVTTTSTTDVTTSTGPSTTDLTTSGVSTGAGFCGDGVVDPAEACDDGGNGDQDDGCTDLCILPACGDGFVQASLQEACDDGNGVGDDGCEPDCTKQTLVKLSLGADHTCALTSHGRVRCWGGNSKGQLGLGNTAILGGAPGDLPTPPANIGPERVVDIAAKFLGTCAVFDTGAVRCWGLNESGELGIGSTKTIGDGIGPLPPQDVTLVDDALNIAGAGRSFCVRTNLDTVRCWGDDDYGQLGLGALPGNIGDMPGELLQQNPVVVGFPVAAIAAGDSHYCAVEAQGGLRCWGYNVLGGLGYDDTEDLGDEPMELPPPKMDVKAGGMVLQVGGGDQHTCALLSTKRVRCWGGGTYGQHGYGNNKPIGDGIVPMPNADVLLGGDVKQLAVGHDHNCALLTDGTVRCWGYNFHGQLGQGGQMNIGDGQFEMPPKPIDFGIPAQDVFSGPDANHTCAVLMDGSLRCWGRNHQGQLGLGSFEDVGDDEPAEAASPVPALP